LVVCAALLCRHESITVGEGCHAYVCGGRRRISACGVVVNPLPPEVLASISAYYRRVTTDAVNRLVALVMILTLLAIAAEIVEGANLWWIGWGSMVLAGSGVIPTLTRTVPNARRLGSGQDSAEKQSALARAIYRDHRFSLAHMSLVLGLQLIAR